MEFTLPTSWTMREMIIEGGFVSYGVDERDIFVERPRRDFALIIRRDLWVPRGIFNIHGHVSSTTATDALDEKREIVAL
jgi:hypothetical protein